MSTLNSLFKKSTGLFISLTAVVLLVCMNTGNASAQSREVTQISFQKDKFSRIFIPVKVNEDSLSLLFSTYSRTLRLTPYFMRTTELYPSWSMLIQKDKNERIRPRMIFYLPKLNIGDLKFRNEETIVNNAFPDTVITGSTGTMFVYQYNWKIDYDKNIISISKTPFEPVQPFTTIKYKNTTFPLAAVEIAGTTDNFLVDFGSGANFLISSGSEIGKQLISSLDLKPSITVVNDIHSHKLTDSIYEAEVPSLLINGVELKNQKVILSSAAPRNTIGSEFLKNYNVILNNSKKRKIGNAIILESRM